MTTPDYDVFVGDGATIGPSRPGVNDLGGGLKENDPDNTPDPVRMPCAEDDNQKTWALAAVCRVIPAAIIEIEYASTVPFVANVWTLRDDITVSDFTIAETAIGELTLSWTAGTFPTGPKPCGLVNNDDAIAAEDIRAERTDVAEISIVTYHSGSGVRTPITLTIGGEGSS